MICSAVSPAKSQVLWASETTVTLRPALIALATVAATQWSVCAPTARPRRCPGGRHSRLGDAAGVPHALAMMARHRPGQRRPYRPARRARRQRIAGRPVMANECDRPPRPPGPLHHRPHAGNETGGVINRRLGGAVEHARLEVDHDHRGRILEAALKHGLEYTAPSILIKASRQRRGDAADRKASEPVASGGGTQLWRMNTIKRSRATDIDALAAPTNSGRFAQCLHTSTPICPPGNMRRPEPVGAKHGEPACPSWKPRCRPADGARQGRPRQGPRVRGRRALPRVARQTPRHEESELWIKIHKLASGLQSITPKEAIDVVLCWGWIDAVRKGFDDKSFLQRYTPRGREQRLEPDQCRQRRAADRRRAG